jgi:maltooligosyltrehalose trehalohydrolase
MTPPETFSFGPTVREGRAQFRLWAPGVEHISLEIEDAPLSEMMKAGDGWFEAAAPYRDGLRYRFRLPDGTAVPDPASRFQPDGVTGPSMIPAPDAYRWLNDQWRGRPWEETVLYELHPGVLGGYAGISGKLRGLADLGVTAIELMPIAEFAGGRNWGYDGVLPFSPSRAYGTPEMLKALIDEAHGLGLMVFLDVVYNHFGPEGNYLPAYAPAFFRDDIHTPWGAAIDFRRSQVRRFYIENALYWLGEFRFDGLRLDAVHAISEQDWIPEMAAIVRKAFPDRYVHLVLENEHNDAQHMRDGVNAQWNDDFHNVMHVMLTGETFGYYAGFADRQAERLARSLAEGFIYQGEPSPIHAGAPRGGKSGDLSPTAFVNFLQNHDQVGNRALGERLSVLTDPECLKAATALLLLSPEIPLIFMGDECGARTPFLFFTDFEGDRADAVREGRRKEFAAFPAFADPEKRESIPDPNAYSTFTACRVDDTTPQASAWREFYGALLSLRREYIVPRLRGARSNGAEALSQHAVIARWMLSDESVLTIASNLGDSSVEASLPRTPPIWGASEHGKMPPKSTIAWITAK